MKMLYLTVEALKAQAAQLTELSGRQYAISCGKRGYSVTENGVAVIRPSSMPVVDMWLSGCRRGLNIHPAKAPGDDACLLAQKMATMSEVQRLEVYHVLLGTYCPGCGSDEGPECVCMK